MSNNITEPSIFTSINRNHIIALVIMPIPVIACISYFDGPIAHTIWRMTVSHPFFRARISYIPDTLPAVTALATILCLICYAYTPAQKRHGQIIEFYQLTAVVLPIAFLLKIILQHMFGRTNIRVWLTTGGEIGFNWFNPTECGGFPSGHSMVSAALFMAVWLNYPKLRFTVAGLLLLLDAALLVTSYHFLSDVLAGNWFGLSITLITHSMSRRALTQNSLKSID